MRSARRSALGDLLLEAEVATGEAEDRAHAALQLVVLTDTGQKSAPVIAEVSIQRTILDPTRPILDTGVLTPTIPTRPRIDSTPVRPRAARPPKPRPPRSDT